jgi:cobalt-zinc-cadmium efflux system protein
MELHQHSHDHTHSHSHAHAPVNFGRVFIIGIALNLLFVIVETLYGLQSGSMALVADAGHNFGDVLSLVFAWIAFLLAKRKPTKLYTYGLRRTTILVALLNSVILLVSLGIIGWESVWHIRHNVPVQSQTIIIVSFIGIIINGLVALAFFKERKSDINAKGVFLHMASDALISLGVVIGGFIIYFTKWYWLDSVISLVIIVIVLISTWKLFVESIDFALDAVPRSIKFNSVFEYLSKIEGVEEVHDLHIWGVSTTETALTVHLVMTKGVPDSNFIFHVGEELHHHFGIEHSTIQIENIFPHPGHHKGF